MNFENKILLIAHFTGDEEEEEEEEEKVLSVTHMNKMRSQAWEDALFWPFFKNWQMHQQQQFEDPLSSRSTM